MYENIRSVLTDYYFDKLPKITQEIKDAVFARMDAYADEHPNASSYELKSKMYDVIAEEMRPRVFDGLPFSFETGVLVATSDGRYRFYKNGINFHANAWLYNKNVHIFEDFDPEAYKQYVQDKGASLYSQTGSFVDIMHIGLPLKKVFKMGLSGVFAELTAIDTEKYTEEERELIDCSKAGILALRKIAKRLSDAARACGNDELADVTERIPWNAPGTFYEGLFAMAFMRKALGSLEGVGFNSFGRVDVLLAPLYEADRARGISDEVQLDYVTKFLLIWDTALDRREKLDTGTGYELENTLTLGGIDKDGDPVFNGVTRLFLRSRNENNIIYPKMMLRYSSRSPREYMEMLAKPLVEGQSYSLLENDDATIPALIKFGIEPCDAMEYTVGGCWDLLTLEQSNNFSGEYFSVMKPFEWAVHGEIDKIEKHKLKIAPFTGDESFDEIYNAVLECTKHLLMRKALPMSRASREWHRVNPVPTLSSLMETCIPKKRDLTAGGGKYNRETVYFSGFSELTDSLLAIKHLCFDKKVCALRDIIDQCKDDWSDEVLRRRALSAPSYGDGSEETSAFAGKLFDDLYALTRGLPTAYGGEFRVGYNQYTEVIWWGKQTKALPNGRKSGDYISPGLTPSRIQNAITVADIIDSLRYIDTSKCAGNSSITLTLPAGGMTLNTVTDLLYAFAKSPIQALQPNCVNVEVLKRAMEEPERYGHIIVRVCGFSAPFVLLSQTYQEEFLSRMISEA